MPTLARTIALGALVLASACRTPPSPPSPSPGAQGTGTAPRAIAPSVMTPPKMAAAKTTPTPADARTGRVDAPPMAPAYDLEGDHALRLQLAQKELGDRVPSAVVEDVFLVVGAPGWDGAAFQQSVSLVKNALAAYMHGRFQTRPGRAISVYLFPSAAPYEAYCKTRWSERCLSKYGFYRPDERKMVMNAGLGLGTLTHELVHPIVEADFPTAPAWINEGIASLFEAPVIPRAGEIHGVKNWRHPRLIGAWASPREKDAARLDALFAMNDDTFRDDAEDLHYAMARYACQWLDDAGKLWAFYQAWRDDVADDPTGEKAFERVVGKPPREMHDAWAKWVKAL
jgi:hypothetical protein